VFGVGLVVMSFGGFGEVYWGFIDLVGWFVYKVVLFVLVGFMCVLWLVDCMWCIGSDFE